MRKKDILYLIIALLGLYVAWRSYTMNKKHIQSQKAAGNGGSGSLLLGGAQPNSSVPVIKVETVIDDCPYCGAKNAEITHTYQDGKVVKLDVVCNNKSCPGSYGGKIVTEFKSSKFAVER